MTEIWGIVMIHSLLPLEAMVLEHSFLLLGFKNHTVSQRHHGQRKGWRSQAV